MSTSTSSHDADGLRIWSCVTCRRRKVRCDRREPCANCVRNSIDCHFPVSGRIPRRRALPAADQTGRSLKERHADLVRRIRRMESVVTELSVQVEEGVGDDAGGSVSVEIPRHPQEEISKAIEAADNAARDIGMSTDSDRMEDIGQMLVAKEGRLHVGKDFWTAFCGEVENIFRSVGDTDDVEFSTDSDEPPVPSTSEATCVETQDHGFVFGFHSERAMQPLPSQIPFLWKTYLSNVDPFIKVLQTPAMATIVKELNGDIASRGPEAEAILMAISLAAIVSLNEEDAAVNFGRPRSELLENFRRGTESALARSEFMTTQNLGTVQAFVIYLAVLPYIGQEKLARSLTGMLLRVATDLKLHKDGSHWADMSFPDGEIRRRLWWQICLLDSHSRDHGAPQLYISDDMFDTAMPVNIEDDLLQTASSVFDANEGKITSMTLFLIRCRVWRLGRTLEAAGNKPVTTQLDLVRSVRSMVWETLLGGVNLSNSFDSFIQAMASLVFARIESFIYKNALRTVNKGAEKTANQVHQHIFRSSLEVVDLVHSLMTREDWRKWRWQLQGQAPWSAMGTVLVHLGQNPWSLESERALESARGILQALDRQQRAENGERARIYDLVGTMISCDRRQQWLAVDATREWRRSRASSTNVSLEAFTDTNRTRERSLVDGGSMTATTTGNGPTLVVQEESPGVSSHDDVMDLNFMDFLQFDDVMPF